MNRPVTHAPIRQFPIVDDELMVAGKTLRQLAERIGSTPFYVYDKQVIRQRIGMLRSVLPDEIAIHYAIKANPLPDLVEFISQQLDGLDVASLGELKLARSTEIAAADISFAGPGKTDQELAAAIEAGVTINIESTGELERVAKLGTETGQQPQIAIRVNPDFELKSAGMRMSGGAKPFGIDAEQIPALYPRLAELDVRFKGLHIYTGSQNLNAEHLISAQNATFDLAYRLADASPAAFEQLNIGGGFGIPYFPGEQALALEPIADNLQQRVTECQHRLGSQVKIILELGRYLVGEAGVYVCRVIDKKLSRGTTYLVVDGGMHHHLAASGNLGQVIRKNFPVVTAHHVYGGSREKVSVVGPLCTPLDILATDMQLGEAQPGDLIAVLQSGAYGASASPQGFLSHPAPAEVLL